MTTHHIVLTTKEGYVFHGYSETKREANVRAKRLRRDKFYKSVRVVKN